MLREGTESLWNEYLAKPATYLWNDVWVNIFWKSLIKNMERIRDGQPTDLDKAANNIEVQPPQSNSQQQYCNNILCTFKCHIICHVCGIIANPQTYIVRHCICIINDTHWKRIARPLWPLPLSKSRRVFLVLIFFPAEQSSCSIYFPYWKQKNFFQINFQIVRYSALREARRLLSIQLIFPLAEYRLRIT